QPRRTTWAQPACLPSTPRTWFQRRQPHPSAGPAAPTPAHGSASSLGDSTYDSPSSSIAHERERRSAFKRRAALHRRSRSQDRGGKGSGGGDRPRKTTNRLRTSTVPGSRTGRAGPMAPSVGTGLTQIGEQFASDALHGSQS